MKNFLVKLDPKQLRMLLALAIIVILFAGYRFGFQIFNDKADKVEEENVVLSQRYDELDALVQMEPVYDEDGKKCKDGIELIKSKYGSVNTPEKSLRFLVDLQYFAIVAIPAINFSPEEVIYSSTDLPSVGGAGIYVYKNPLSITFKTTYFGYKQMMDYINTNSVNMNVSDVTISFDSETSSLTGNMVINQYAMTGTETQYEQPSFNVPGIGTDNIFGTLERKQ